MLKELGIRKQLMLGKCFPSGERRVGQGVRGEVEKIDINILCEGCGMSKGRNEQVMFKLQRTHFMK